MKIDTLYRIQNMKWGVRKWLRQASCILHLATGIWLLSLVPHLAIGQSFAVQSTTQLIPPYSVYLSDYATPGNEKLQVILIHRDLTQPSYQIRLVMMVELNGKVIMRTSRGYNPRPISLDPGIPTVISGADLAPYLDSRNIDFVAYSRDQYERTKSLPEGSYRICFVAYDYRRQDVQVSNDGCNFYYLSKSEPPLTNMPICGTKVEYRNPQQIVFSWLPRNTASPTSAADTEYELALYETRPAGRNPNDVVLTTQPVFRTKTDQSQFVFGPAETLLLEGMTYVWRVQAIDKNGKDAFRNNGYSEVCTFRYGGFDPQFDIGVVKKLQAEAETERRGRIWWETGDYESYRVEYRKSGKDYKGEPYEWFTSDTREGEIKLYDLEPDTEYQTRVLARKNNAYGPSTETVTFRTTPIRVAHCGESPVLPQITNTQPLQFATTGMVINARGFDMILVEVEKLSQQGYYKGIGKVAPTYLGGATFYVKFERLYIDETRTVVGPDRIDFITEGVASMMQEQLAEQKERQQDRQQRDNREQWAGTEFHEQIFLYDQPIDTVVVDPNGNLVVTYANGITETNTEIAPILTDTPEKAVIIEDKNGDQWVVQKDKTTGETKVTKVEGGGLVVGADGKILTSRELRKLDRMILASVRKLKKSIEDYWAANNIQPPKGRGPYDESGYNAAELPVCLEENKDKLVLIYNNLVLWSDSATTQSQEFLVDISPILIQGFTDATDAADKLSTTRIDDVVCEKAVEAVSSIPSLVVQLQNGGITLTYKGVTGTLKEFGFAISKVEVRFKVTKTEANPSIDLGQEKTIESEVDALFARAAAYVQVQLSNKEFTKTELEQWVFLNQAAIKKYLDDLVTDVSQSGLEDLVGLSASESTALKASIKKFKDNHGIDPTVTVVDEPLFNLLKAQYTSGQKKSTKDVHLIVDKTGKSYSFFYKDGFFTIPTQKTVALTGETIQLTGSQSEIFAIRDQVIATAITNDDIEGVGKINEPTLNIFEKGMWIVKVTKETLADIKVPIPMWDGKVKESQPIEKRYPFKLQATVAGIGDGLVDEFKSIPDLLLMGLSLFNKEERDGLVSAVSSINLETLKGMFQEKADKYKAGGDVASHEGGYDVVQVASVFWGGALMKGKKATDKAGDVMEVLQKLSQDVKDKMVTLSAKQRDEILRDLGSSPELLEKMTADMVDAWRILNDAGRASLKVDPDVLTKLNKVLKNSKLNDFLPINTATRNITKRIELIEQVVKLQDEAGGIVGKRMSSMSDLMDELDYFLVNFADKPGASEFIKELSESGGKMAGGSFVLKTLKNHAVELGAIVKFESTIASQVDDIGDIVVDVITDKDFFKNVFNEFKNWRSIPSNRYSSFSKQFTGYLTSKNVGEFSYFFKKGVDGNGFNNLSELKDQVVNAFSSSTGRAELSKLDLEKVKSITNNPLLDDINKVDGLIDYLDDLDNFEQIFKLIE